MQQVLVHQILLKMLIQLLLKSSVDKLDIDKLEKGSNDLSSLRNKAKKLYTGKLGTSPVCLSKLSDLVKHNFVKKTKCD